MQLTPSRFANALSQLKFFTGGPLTACVKPSFLLIVALAMSCMVFSLIFWLAYVTLGRRAHAKSWALCFGGAGVMFGVSLTRGIFPSASMAWIVSAALSCTTVTLGILGHLQRVGRPFTTYHWFGAIGTFALVVWFTVAMPHFGLRIALLPLHAAAMNGLAAWLIINFRQRTLPAELGAAAFCAAFALCQLAAGIVALSQGATMNADTMAIYSIVNFVAMPPCFLGMGMFCVFILASDMAEQLRELASIDPLTGLANRRGMNEAMARAWATAQRAGHPISILLADLDGFKRINDERGHEVGDDVLKAVAERFQDNRRAGDVVARWGGEEFVIMLCDTDEKAAEAIAKRLDAKIQAAPVDTLDGPIYASASIGVATAVPGRGDMEALIRRADADMYERKMVRKVERARVEVTQADDFSASAPAM